VLEKAVAKACSFADIGKRMEYLLATGNLVSRSGMGLSQTSGFTIVAEKLNFLRYLSHFRSVHRGAYFQELRTTTVRAPAACHPFKPATSVRSLTRAVRMRCADCMTQVRKLLPDSWGFMCPVHTPDGSPCGLLNHLAAPCEIVVDVSEDDTATSRAVCSVLAAAGMVPCTPALTLPNTPEHIAVMLDGVVVGSIRASAASDLVLAIRRFKVRAAHRVSSSEALV
jgi:DNA-directed RNA polymerase I subunit RPA2